MKCCSECGTRVEPRTENLEWYCPHCRRSLYANPVPTIDAMLFDEQGRILLGVRKQEPGRGKLNLPGGFMDMDETLEEGLARELHEELGLTAADHGPFVYAGSRVEMHLEKGMQRQILPVIMVATMPHREFEPNDEVEQYVWRRPADLEAHDLTTQQEYDHIQAAAKVAHANGIA